MDGFWINGPYELLKSEKTQLKIAHIKDTVKFKYEKDLKTKNPFKKALVKLKMHREINNEINKIVPPNALW